jgi:hypothetical protein
LDLVREELGRILKSTPLWDGKVSALQVTNASDRTIELRALMSASDSARAFDLRCYVREKLIGYLQERYPGSLPRVRAEIQGAEVSVAPPSQPLQSQSRAASQGVMSQSRSQRASGADVRESD